MIGPAHRPPAAKGRVGQMGRDIGLRLGSDWQVVGGDPGGDRREKGIRRRIGAEKPRPARPEPRPCTRPDQLQPGNICQNLGARGAVLIAGQKVHGAIAPQLAKTRMHLGHHIARHHPCRGVLRPVARIGVPFGQRLQNGDAFADHFALGRADRGHLSCGLEVRQKPLQIVAVKDTGMHPNLYPELFEHQPAAQGPAGITSVANGQIIGHRRFSRPFPRFSQPAPPLHVELRDGCHHRP